ncbi:MAG: hypothetical protein MZV70_71645 [Desulfobacterales bacterium]|nr:hypothetical protein [Desulfobacterales bacterium]
MATRSQCCRMWESFSSTKASRVLRELQDQSPGDSAPGLVDASFSHSATSSTCRKVKLRDSQF